MGLKHSKNIEQNNILEISNQLQEFSFDDIKNDIKPFDLICFRGDEFVSNAISNIEKKIFGNGDWTHVGIVITHDILPFKNADPKKIYIWEATMSGSFGDTVYDIETGKGKFGIQIRDLHQVIKKYIKNDTTKVGWCKLIDNPYNIKKDETLDEYNIRIENIKNEIFKFYILNGNARYDYKITTMLKTIFPSLTKNKFLKNLLHTENSYFCSEFVTVIYEILGIIPTDIDPEAIAPIELLGYTNDNIGKIVDEPILLCHKK